MTSSEDAQKDMNNRFFKARINRIIDYADLNNLQDQVEFLENPGWMGTFQTLHEIEKAINTNIFIISDLSEKNFNFLYC